MNKHVDVQESLSARLLCRQSLYTTACHRAARPRYLSVSVLSHEKKAGFVPDFMQIFHTENMKHMHLCTWQSWVEPS